MKRDKGSTSRQQERIIFARGFAKRSAEFAEYSEALAAFLRAGQTAKSLEEYPKVYTRVQSCVDKLMLACFCLRIPLRKTTAAVALLLSKSISPANIAGVAAILEHKLVTYQRRLIQNRGKLESLLGGINRTAPKILQTDLERAHMPNTRTSDINRSAVFPTTILELEKGLDDLLIFLRAIDAASWNQLKAAGLVKERSRRSR